MSYISQTFAHAEWPRTLLAIGFFTILVGVAVGAATDGSPVAQYFALLGLLPIGAGAIGLVVQRLLRFWGAQRISSPE